MNIQTTDYNELQQEDVWRKQIYYNDLVLEHFYIHLNYFLKKWNLKFSHWINVRTKNSQKSQIKSHICFVAFLNMDTIYCSIDRVGLLAGLFYAHH